MGITIIDNQVVKFNKTQPGCICWEKPFCQLVNSNDETQFEIKSSQLIANGNFDSGLDGWNVIDEIIVSAYPVNTTEDVCEGEIEATATGGNGGPYQYSIDGVNFQESNLFENLCEGDYTIVAKDSDGNEGSQTFTIYVNANCGDYQCSTLQDLIDSGLPLGAFMNCTLADFLCEFTGIGYDPNYIFFSCPYFSEFTVGQTIGVKIGDDLYNATIAEVTSGTLPGVGSGCFLTLEEELFDTPVAVTIYN